MSIHRSRFLFKFPVQILAAPVLFAAFSVSVLSAQEASTPASVSAPSQADTIAAMKKEIDSLSQKVTALQKTQQDQGVAQAPSKPSPHSAVVTADSSGFRIASEDKRFSLQLKGLLQTDVREFLTPSNNGGSPGDGIYLRRARLIFDGELWGAYTFRIEPEFGSRTGGAGGTSSTTATLANAYFNIHYIEPLQLQVGRFKGPIGYERSQLVANNIWVENGLTQDLTPQYNQAILLHGTYANVVSYSGGIMEGVRDNSSNDLQGLSSNNFDFFGSLNVDPFRHTDIKALQGLGFGLAGSVGNRGSLRTAANAPLPTYTTPGQTSILTYNTTSATGQTVTESEDGPGYRLTPVLYYYYGPFGGYADYALSNQRDLRSVTGTGAGTGNRYASFTNEAWQVVGSYVLTGENASYTGVIPRHDFNFHDGSLGAFQIAARYGELTLDQNYFAGSASGTSAGSAFVTQGARVTHDIGAEINWYLNRNLKAQLQYDYTSYTGGTGAVTNQNADQNVFLTQLQLAF